MICKKNISSHEIINFYTKTMEEFWKLIDECKCFGVLLHCMYGKDKEREMNHLLLREIEDDLSEFYFFQ